MKLLPPSFCHYTRLTIYAVILAFSSSFAFGQDTPGDKQADSNAELLKAMKRLEEKVATLEKRLSHYEDNTLRHDTPASSAKLKTNLHDDYVPASGPTDVTSNESFRV